MPEEQITKPVEKKAEPLPENLPEFVPAPSPEQSEISKTGVGQPSPASAQPVIPPSASTSKLTADELAILNAMEMEKEEMKATPISTSQIPASLPAATIQKPITPAVSAATKPSAPSNISPISSSPVPEKKKFEFHFPFMVKPKEMKTDKVNEIKKTDAIKQAPLAQDVPVKPSQANPAVQSPKEKGHLFPIFANKPEQKQADSESAEAPPTTFVEKTERSSFAPQVIADNWKKIIPVLILVGIFAIFLMLRNSISFMTGYAISGVPLLTTDYISILLLGILAFAAIFGTEKLMNKMYKYM